MQPTPALGRWLAAFPEPALAWDRRGRCTFANRAACELLASEPESLVGRRLGELSEGARARLFPEETLARALEEGSGRAEVELPEGGRCEFVLSACPDEESGGAEPALLALGRVSAPQALARAWEEARARAEASEEETALLYRLTDAALRAERIEEVCEAALEAVVRALGAPRASVLLADARGVMRFVASRGLSEGYRRAVDGHSPWRVVRAPGEPEPEALLVEDAEADASMAAYRETFRAEGIRALAFVPLLHERALLGKFMVYHATPHRFGEREQRLARAIAGQIAQGVARLGAREAAERRERRQRLLAEASAALSDSLDYELTLERVARAAVPRVGDMAGVYLLEQDGSIRQVAVAHVDPEKVPLLWELDRLLPLHVDQDRLLSSALRAGEARFVEELPEAMRTSWSGAPRSAEILGRLGLRSYVAVPLRARSRVIGALAFSTSYLESGRRLGPEDVSLAEELARRAGIAMEHAELYRDAQRASRLKDEFLATLSHELRTPLSAVLGWARMLRTKPADAVALARGLEAIERNARAQASLVEDLLDVSRIVSGKLCLQVRRVDVGALVQAAVDAVRPAAVAKNLDLDVAVDEGAGELSADPDRIRQVVWNLVSNAVKFTPQGGCVRVRVGRKNGSLRIAVSDSGCGISPAFLPHLFERFTQADQSTTRRHGGLGLGLAIVRHLVELHGGSVEASSEGEGKGSSFTVTIPVAAASRGEVEEVRPTPLPAAPEVAAPSLAGLRVLVVEDDADAAELVAVVLGEHGARVRTAASAREALGVLSAFAPDVLVSDVGMPGELDGYGLIREVRALPVASGGAVPAVALTAYARREDRERALESGFSAYLAKPVETADLVTVVAELAARVSRPAVRLAL